MSFELMDDAADPAAGVEVEIKLLKKGFKFIYESQGVHGELHCAKLHGVTSPSTPCSPLRQVPV